MQKGTPWKLGILDADSELERIVTYDRIQSRAQDAHGATPLKGVTSSGLLIAKSHG